MRNGRARPDWRVRVIVDGRAEATAVGRHLERFGCHVVELRPQGLLLELPYASDGVDAEAEARLYLAMWHARHPHSNPSLADGPSQTA